jgi:diguanylate cyclase (GGDEF)-like protein
MLQIGYFTNESFSKNELFKIILDKVIESMGIGYYGSITIVDDDKLRIAVARGYREADVESFCIDIKESIGGPLTDGNIDGATIVNVTDGMKQVLNTEDGLVIKSIIFAPIIVEDGLYGFISIDSVEDDAFSEMDKELMEYISFQLAITISKYALYEETIFLSKHDKLTNLYNRSYFEQLVNTDILRYMKEGKDFRVVILDLDDLKYVNDSYGHVAGDKFIRTFATEFKKCIAGSDILARFGGDEFIGVSCERDIENITSCLEDLISHFQNVPITAGEYKFNGSFSYGISRFPEDGEDFGNLIKIADERMYEYKTNK